MEMEILINCVIYELCIVIVENGYLVEIWIECPDFECIVGDVYKGMVSVVLLSFQVVFIEIGLECTVFLQVRDMVEVERSDIESGGLCNGRCLCNFLLI